MREWHQGRMSSRELLNMLAGMPADSWFKGSVREDMDELVGDATTQQQRAIREKTEALLRGEIKTSGRVEITTEMNDPEGRRSSTSAYQA